MTRHLSITSYLILLLLIGCDQSISSMQDHLIINNIGTHAYNYSTPEDSVQFINNVLNITENGINYTIVRHADADDNILQVDVFEEGQLIGSFSATGEGFATRPSTEAEPVLLHNSDGAIIWEAPLGPDPGPGPGEPCDPTVICEYPNSGGPCDSYRLERNANAEEALYAGVIAVFSAKGGFVWITRGAVVMTIDRGIRSFRAHNDYRRCLSENPS
jgi:hypothetical protein